MRRYEFINGFIENELDIFAEEFDQTPYPREFDLRTMSIAWICESFGKQVSKKCESRILTLIDANVSKEDYKWHRWHRIPGLLAAAYTLTRNKYYLDLLLPNLAAGQSAMRRNILECAAIIVRGLTFDQYLTQTTETNIEYHHFFWEQHVLLSLASVGERDEKRNWLSDITAKFPNEMTRFTQKLQEEKYIYRDGYLADVFNEIKSFILVRMLSDIGIIRESIYQPNLPESETDAETRFKYVRAHPLDTYYVNLEFLK